MKKGEVVGVVLLGEILVDWIIFYLSWEGRVWYCGGD